MRGGHGDRYTPAAVFAPRLFFTVTALVAAMLMAGGCTVPGSSRLQGPPKDLPPALAYVTADALGYSLYDTNPDSKRWKPLAPVAGVGDDNEPLQVLHSALTGGFPADLAKVQPWVGDAAGVALRELDLDGKTETSTLYWADVRSRSKLERFLEDEGWKQQRDADAGDDDLTLWTHLPGCDDTPGGAAAVCAAPPHQSYTAAAVGDDAIVAARTPKALRSLLASADEYAVPERQAMSKFTVEAASRVPMSAVFRFDLIRTQARRPFEGDPALLEFARWATDATTLVAARDGWFGIAPPLPSTDSEGVVQSDLRVVGAAEWVPDLAPEISLEPVPKQLLDRVDEPVDVAVAMHDPGQYLADLLAGITFKATQYATEQDVPDDEDRSELLPVLDQLDGDGVVGWDGLSRRLQLSVEVADAAATAKDVTTALATAGVDGTAVADGRFVDIEASFGRAPAGRVFLKTGPQPRRNAIAAAGPPPRQPVAWVWSASTRCTTASGGWLTFDGTDRMTTSLAVNLIPSSFGPNSRCDLLSSLGLHAPELG